MHPWYTRGFSPSFTARVVCPRHRIWPSISIVLHLIKIIVRFSQSTSMQLKLFPAIMARMIWTSQWGHVISFLLSINWIKGDLSFELPWNQWFRKAELLPACLLILGDFAVLFLVWDVELFSFSLWMDYYHHLYENQQRVLPKFQCLYFDETCFCMTHFLTVFTVVLTQEVLDCLPLFCFPHLTPIYWPWNCNELIPLIESRFSPHKVTHLMLK